MQATLRRAIGETWRQTRTTIADGVRRLRARADGTLAHAVRRWAGEALTSLRERTDGRSPHALAAGGVKAVTGVLEVAAGPLAAVAIAAASEVAVVGIATHAVRRRHGSHRELRVVLDVVIVELARDRLCATHVAAGWRAACGIAGTRAATRPLAAGIARTAARELASHAATRALRRAGLRKFLWIGSVAALAQLPREVRRTYALVERAERAAAPTAEGTSLLAESAPVFGT